MNERPPDRRSGVRLCWDVKIPMRDGVRLNAILYLPGSSETRVPVILTMTPYIAQAFHEYGKDLAGRGYVFLCVDVRGRGGSEGIFKPNINEAKDGYDVVEWVAQQSYCNGRVAMLGGSYMGYAQWATAKEFPPHLASIAPVAAPYFGVDFPMRGNIAAPYLMQWLMLVAGRALNDKIFFDQAFWNDKFRQWFEAGTAFRELDRFLGYPSEVFQEWCSHPELDDYWTAYNPTAEQYARLSLPILTITGAYDGDQPGALMHFREHLKHCSEEARRRHYLVIGPWDHTGTRVPRTEFAGIKVGPNSLVDLARLHAQWYAWTLQEGPQPEFLRANVAYYVMVADKWRYADSLDDVTARVDTLFLQSSTNPCSVFRSGELVADAPLRENDEADCYVYDPSDVSGARVEGDSSFLDHTDQREVYRSAGGLLVYHSTAYERDVEISGFFRLVVWLAIDQPDTDFQATIYEIDAGGGSVLLTADRIRARYRRGLHAAELIRTTEPLRYEFNGFSFISRQVSPGCRLRLVIGPVNSIHSQKNYNSGGVVADETMRDARPVIVNLYHDRVYQSALYVPYGRPDS